MLDESGMVHGPGRRRDRAADDGAVQSDDGKIGRVRSSGRVTGQCVVQQGDSVRVLLAHFVHTNGGYRLQPVAGVEGEGAHLRLQRWFGWGRSAHHPHVPELDHVGAGGASEIPVAISHVRGCNGVLANERHRGDEILEAGGRAQIHPNDGGGAPSRRPFRR